jgi:predicted nucleic acid-binding protein
MILVDTSVWIEHLRGGRRARSLADLLEEERVLIHPWIVGELALGHLGRRRSAILADLGTLEVAARVEDGEVMEMIEARSLRGAGIGWVDAHLLASALVSDCQLWTLDSTLGRAARSLGILRG